MSSRVDDARVAFEVVYGKDHWALEDAEWQRSKPGLESEESRWSRLTTLLQDFMALNDIRSVVDFGCGFWSFMKRIDWAGIRYDGFDVVKSVTAYNTDAYARDNVRFHLHRDGVIIPPADLLFSKDVLQHLPTADVLHYLQRFRQNHRFLLIANDVWPEDNLNGDVPAGGYRALDLSRPPFSEQFAVLQRWECEEFGARTVKHFCLLLGQPEQDGRGFTAATDGPAPAPPVIRAAPMASRSLLRRLRRV